MNWILICRVSMIEVLTFGFCFAIALIVYPGMPMIASLVAGFVIYVLSSIITFTLDLVIWFVKRKVLKNV